jgi:hypothetical protein
MMAIVMLSRSRGVEETCGVLVLTPTDFEVTRRSFE